MATVTAFTAEKSQEIEDALVASAAVNNSGHLILTKNDTTVIDAGFSGVKVVTSATRPTGASLYTGLNIYESDTKRFYFYNGTAWVYSGGLWICTSGTRPASPFEGLQIYETDTDKVYMYDGTNWTLPKNVPGGILGISQVTADQTGITAAVDLTGLSKTVTVLANRYIKITAVCMADTSINANGAVLYIFEGATELTSSVVLMQNAAVGETMIAQVVLNAPSAGSHTYKLRMANAVGGTVIMQANATRPAYILIEDIGGV